MKGKYINTVIIMAAKSGKKTGKPVQVNETLAAMGNHKIFWSKSYRPAAKSIVIYRSATALIH